ncbi:MAG TPA: hypothetical protein VF543_05945 [Pyrinomonadaceae bacterium]|jgi:L-asparagine transporter-like permease
MKQSFWKFVRNYGLLILWLAATFLLYSWYQSDYQIEQNIIGLSREHNYDEPYRMTNWVSVLLMVAVLTSELVILYLILRPWSYHGSIGRILLAMALFIMLLSLSLGEVFGISNYAVFHELWLLIVNCVLVLCILISGISMLVMKERNAGLPNNI